MNMKKAEYNMALWKAYVEKQAPVDAAKQEGIIRMGSHFARGDVSYLYTIQKAIEEEQRFCTNQQIELTYERDGEDCLLCYEGEKSVFEEQELREMLTMMLGIFEDILPLGSVVDLKKAFLKEQLPVEQVEHVRVVITHRFVGEGPGGLYYPYAGTVYPIGIPGSRRRIQFTPALIEEVVHRGFCDEQEDAYIYLMKEELLLEKKMKSVGFADKQERVTYQKYIQEMEQKTRGNGREEAAYEQYVKGGAGHAGS